MKQILALSFCLFSSLFVRAAPQPPVTALCYSPSGKVLAIGTYGEVALLDVGGNEIRRKLTGLIERVTAIAFSKDGTRLAVASGQPSKSGLIHLWKLGPTSNVLEAEKPTIIQAHQDIIYTLSFSPDGKMLASAGYDRIIQLWDTSTTQSIRTLKDHSDTVFSVAFHPDGKLLASASGDRAVKVWDVHKGTRLHTLSEPTDWVYAVCWHPLGKHLAAAGIDKSIRVWDANMEGNKLVHSVFAHTQPVTRLAYSSDGRTLFSMSEGKNLKRWDTATMKESLVFPPQPQTLLSLALRPDDQQVAVGRYDGVVVVFNAADGKEIGQPFPAKPKPPQLNKISPAFGPRGKTIRIRAEGQNLDDVAEATFSLAGGTAKVLPNTRSSTGVDLDLSIPASIAPGIGQLALKSAAGTSANLGFIVDRYPVTEEKGAIDSASKGLTVTVPTTVVGKIHKAGDCDFYRFELQQGQQLGVQVLSTVLGSKLESIIQLTDASGKILAQSTNGLLGFVCHSSGTYALGIRDKEYRGGAEMFYRIHLGEIPIITGVFPLGLQRGTQETIQVRGVHLPGDGIVKMTAPKDALTGTQLPVSLPAIKGESPLGDASLVIGEFPEIVIDARDEEKTVASPGTANGIIAKPGRMQTLRFSAQRGETQIIEVHARQLGSPLDSFIEVLDQGGKPVIRSTLRSVSRTFSTFRDHDSVSAGIRLESWNGLAMEDLLYVDGEIMKILDLPKNPDDDCQFYQVAGQRLGFFDTTPIHHSNGSAMYKIEMHAPGSTFPPNGLPTFQLAYRNDDGGPGYGKDSRLFFTPPADGIYKVRIGDSRGLGGADFAYRLTIREPRPDFKITFSPTPTVPRGGSTPVSVTARRIDGYDGPIACKFENLPAGIEMPSSSIESGQTTTTVPLYAAGNAAIPEKTAPLKLIASANIGGRQIIHEATAALPKLIDPGDIITTTALGEVNIHPGQEARLLVKIERKNGFKGRIPLEVKGLPHGVRVLNIGLNGILVTERDAEREIVIYAEPWVKPAEVPFIVMARQESKGSIHGAKGVLLRVK
jgi:WD40 repeat protein